MKRKVKFQEGGAVEEPARRPAPRSRMSRMSEAARNRFSEARAAAQREVERLNAMRDVEDFNRRVQRGQVNAETMRRMGATELPSGRQDFTTNPEGVTRRGTATGREVAPFREPGTPAPRGGRELVPFQEPGAPATRPSASRALANVATPRQIPLGSTRPPVGGNVATIATGLATGLAEPLVNYGRGFMDRRAEEIALANARRAQAAGTEELAPPDEISALVARNQRPTPAPAPAQSRPAAPRPRVRETSADELNDMELRRIRAERQMEEEAALAERMARARAREESMGGSGDIGAASARARGEQVGPPGDYNNFRKGGMVKAKAKPVAKKAGGMVAAKPAAKKMMKGGMVAKPKSKAKPSGKPMPAFKKGGAVKKGKR